MKNRSPSKMSSQGIEDKLKIIIRIRPVLSDEDPHEFVNYEDNNTLQIKRPGNHCYMKFSNILPLNSSQKDVFDLVEDSVKQFLQGINTTIFAYGQTGAGKTYSIMGNYSSSDSQENLFNFLSSKERGVLSRSLELIMLSLENNPMAKVSVSFLEIYNEKIYDLYNNTLTPLEIRESKGGEISLPELINVEVTCMEDAIDYLMIGLKNRATGSTHANAKSSRSHSIFQINLEHEQENGSVINSSLRIVDLAGSEKFKIPSDLSNSEKEIRIQELTSINSSLSCLGHCISALIEKSRTHVPFRNSKLTRILSDSLLGMGKMRFIICISPSLSASAETFSTLQFANRAKKAIFERAEMRTPPTNKKKSENEDMTLMRKELEREREQRIVLEKEIQFAKQQNTQLKNENSKLLMRMKDGHMPSKSQSSLNSLSCSKDKSRIENKENDFKEEMLKLPIFQKQNRQTQSRHDQNKNQHQNKNQYQNKSEHYQQHNRQEPKYQKSISNKMAQNKSQFGNNKKKAEFEKKIRKFIESDSPIKSYKQPRIKTQYNNYQKQRNFGNEYSFQNHGDMRLPQNMGASQSRGHQNLGMHQEAYEETHEVMHHKMGQDKSSRSKVRIDDCQELWNTEGDDTNQFIERACTNMDMNEFKDLRTEMDRARQELSNLRKKDSELESRKVRIV